MWFTRTIRQRLLLPVAMLGSTVFGSCGATEIRNSFIAGSLDAVRAAAGDLLGPFLML